MEQHNSNFGSHKSNYKAPHIDFGPTKSYYGAPKLWGCVSFNTPYSNVYMCWKTTSTLVYVMARAMNTTEPDFLIHPNLTPTLPLFFFINC